MSNPGSNPFTVFTEELEESYHATPQSANSIFELRRGHDPEKVLALISAVLGLFAAAGDHAESAGTDHGHASRGNGPIETRIPADDGEPKKLLTRLASFLLPTTPPLDKGKNKRQRTDDSEESEITGEHSKKRRTSSTPVGLSTPSSKVSLIGPCTPQSLEKQSSVSSSIVLREPISSLPSPAPSSARRSLISGQSRRSTGTAAGVDKATSSAGGGHGCWNMIRQESYSIFHQFSSHSSALKDAYEVIKAEVKPIVLEKLRECAMNESSIKAGLELAAAIDLLKLFGHELGCVLEDIGAKAREGAILIEEGLNLVSESKKVLQSNFDEVSKDMVS